MSRRSSNPRRTRLANRPGGKRTLALVGLGFFALADVALIALALGAFDLTGRADLDDAATRPMPTLSSSASPEPSQTAAPIPPASSVLRTLAVVDEQTAWRAERGDCGTQAVIEVTSDGGVSWTPTQPVTTEGHEVLWLWAQDEDYAQAAVTAGDSCEVTGIRTFTAGNFWQLNAAVLADAVYLASDGSLVSPSPVTAPCDAPVDLAERGDALAVLCADGTLHESLDGAAWTQTSVPGAIAVADAGEGYVAAVRQLDGCEGIALVSISSAAITSGASASEARSCVAGAVDPAATVLETSSDAVWLWSGGEQAIADIAMVLP